MKISTVRGLLYTLARTLGDIQAVRKGPAAVERRIVRRLAGKVTGKLLGNITK